MILCITACLYLILFNFQFIKIYLFLYLFIIDYFILFFFCSHSEGAKEGQPFVQYLLGAMNAIKKNRSLAKEHLNV
jgi:hypothetical protein